jgi:hypothetical protein
MSERTAVSMAALAPEAADADTIPDASDHCPDEPEDRDGIEDEDGCVDGDNEVEGHTQCEF